MKILIIRHGDPDYEHDTLTEKGFREAELLAERLIKYNKMDYFYVSTYGRAIDTSKPTLKRTGKEAVVCDWLHEFDYPITWDDGTKRPIVWDMFPEVWTRQEKYYDFRHWAETAELESGDIKSKFEYVTGKLDSLLAEHGYERKDNYYEAKQSNTDTLVFFCHFGLEIVLLSHLLNISPILLWHGMVAQPSSVTTLCTEERKKGIAYFRMSTFGDISHLTEAGEEPSFSARFCETYDNYEQRH